MAGGGGGGGSQIYQPIKTIVLAVASDLITFGGLDGDEDNYYVVRAVLKSGVAGTTAVHLRPNGSDANLSSAVSENNGAGVSAFGVDYAYMGSLNGIGFETSFDCEMFAKTGLRRSGWMTGMRSIANLGRGNSCNFGWDDSVTNITSLDIFAEGATGHGFDVGSFAQLYRIKAPAA